METAEQRQRRMTVVRYLDRIIPRLVDLTDQRLLLSYERPVANGVNTNWSGPNHVEPWEARERRLRLLIQDLRILRSRLATSPIPTHWLSIPGTLGVSSLQRNGTNVDIPLEVVADVARFYEGLATERGRPQDEQMFNTWFLLDLPQTRGGSRNQRSTGIHLDVPDPDRRPHEVTRLSPWAPQRGTILDLYRDDRGRPFYLWRGRRQYLLREP